MSCVTLTRAQILTFGPVLLVATCYAVAAPSRDPSNQNAPRLTDDEAFVLTATDEPLGPRCEAAANLLRARLPPEWTVSVRVPYIVSGDLTGDELERHYRETIIPTERALAVSYFDRQPCHPVVILICSSDDGFRECNLRLDNQDRNRYSGLYSRKHRRVVVNISSGEGTLAHELTHALAHADFPTMPEWFDEGLSSLHEECEFSSNGLHLIGRENWRRGIALEALNRGELRLLEDVTTRRFGLVERANLDYAHVRSLCLYLQERGILESFYRTCRSNATTDPTGLRSLCQVANASAPGAFDDAFRAWLISPRTQTP
jgi:hypothetical protein